MKIICKVKEICAERGITQAKFCEMANIHVANVTGIWHNTAVRFERNHLTRAAKALGITRVEDLLELVFEDEDKEWLDTIKTEEVAPAPKKQKGRPKKVKEQE